MFYFTPTLIQVSHLIQNKFNFFLCVCVCVCGESFFIYLLLATSEYTMQFFFFFLKNPPCYTLDLHNLFILLLEVCIIFLAQGNLCLIRNIELFHQNCFMSFFDHLRPISPSSLPHPWQSPFQSVSTNSAFYIHM